MICCLGFSKQLFLRNGGAVPCGVHIPETQVQILFPRPIVCWAKCMEPDSQPSDVNADGDFVRRRENEIFIETAVRSFTTEMVRYLLANVPMHPRYRTIMLRELTARICLG